MDIEKKQNVFELNQLKEILNIIETKNINENLKFSSFSIVKGHNKIIKEEEVLFFPINLKTSDDGGGWYIDDFDGSKKINDYIDRMPNATFVINKDIKKSIKNQNVRLIIVDDIMESIDKLFYHIINNRNFKTILVTGSIGKTSTVGLIESAIKDNVLRIYSKRITPIILKANVINYLTENINYVTFETGMFYQHHIKYFSEIMKPYISVILNILPEHIGIDNIKNINDITKCKIQLLKYSKYALINLNDKELIKIKFRNKKIYYDNFIMDSNIEKVYDISKYNLELKPPINTKLSYIQFQTALIVGNILKIDNKILLDRINNSSFVENRMEKHIIYNHDIVFDGEVSGVARFSIFTDHCYKKEKIVLIIRKLTVNGEENENYIEINKYFDRFDKVFIFNDQEELEILKGDNVVYVKNHDFIKNIPLDTIIFYHYGSYYRKYENFDFSNLERIN